MFEMTNMEGLPDRVRDAFSGAGARQIARDTGLPVGTVQSILNGSIPRADTLARLAAASGRSVDWFLGLERPGRERGAESPSFPSVPRYDVALSAGPGAFVDRAELLDHIPFTQEFFSRRLNRSPKGLVMVDARGDSMEPTISDRDLVMIDTADTQLAPAIWAFTLDDAVLVKRLSPTVDGIAVISDNRLYDRQLITAAHHDGFALIGRVVWVGRVL